jgi:hypothetical protein
MWDSLCVVVAVLALWLLSSVPSLPPRRATACVGVSTGRSRNGRFWDECEWPRPGRIRWGVIGWEEEKVIVGR